MICPFCKKEKIRPIIYGEIGFRYLNDLKNFEERFFNGGEKNSKDSPDFHCDSCEKNFNASADSPDKRGQTRSNLKSGLHVAIVLKADQSTGKLTEGIIKDILTGDSFHHRGIKVRLTDGQVGRVQKIL